MPLWKQESERAWKVFKGLCFMPWHILWQKVLRVSQEMRVKLGSGVKAGKPRFPGGTCLAGSLCLSPRVNKKA